MDNALFSFIYSRKGIYGILHVIILFLSFFLVISISIDTFKNISFLNEPEYLKIQFWICIFFLFDFFLELFLSHDKIRYLRTHFLFFLISIPYLNIMRMYDITFSAETDYLLRFVPLIRGGYAMAIVVGWFSASKASNMFKSYIAVLVSTIYFATLIFYVQENKLNPMIHNYWDALWWATMDVTTVGSNIYAITPVGKFLSVVLAAIGMMMFPIFTVYITSLVQKENQLKDGYNQKTNEITEKSVQNDETEGEEDVAKGSLS